MSHTFYIQLISIYRSIPESVVSPGIALAISAMAFPSCCIRDTVGADVGAAVGADMEEEDVDHYFIVRNSLNDAYLHLSDDT